MAIRFDAAGDYVMRSASAPAQYPLTVCFWLYITTDRNAYGNLFIIANAGGTSFVMFSLSSSGTNLQISVNGNTTNGSNLSTGTWYHIACVIASATSQKVYLNGVLDIDKTSTSTTFTAAQFFMGSDTVGFLNGRLDRAKIFSAALTAAEILREMSVIDPVTNTPWAWYQMIAGDRLADSSGNGRNLTAGGTLADETSAPVGTDLPAIAFDTRTTDAAGTGSTPVDVSKPGIASRTTDGLSVGVGISDSTRTALDARTFDAASVSGGGATAPDVSLAELVVRTTDAPNTGSTAGDVTRASFAPATADGVSTDAGVGDSARPQVALPTMESISVGSGVADVARLGADWTTTDTASIGATVGDVSQTGINTATNETVSTSSGVAAPDSIARPDIGLATSDGVSAGATVADALTQPVSGARTFDANQTGAAASDVAQLGASWATAELISTGVTVLDAARVDWTVSTTETVSVTDNATVNDVAHAGLAYGTTGDVSLSVSIATAAGVAIELVTIEHVLTVAIDADAPLTVVLLSGFSVTDRSTTMSQRIGAGGTVQQSGEFTQTLAPDILDAVIGG